jgi:TonB family protein
MATPSGMHSVDNVMLPLGLRRALESGNCVLFVGAALRAHVLDKTGKPAPDGEELARRLADHFGIDAGGEYDLAVVSEIVEIRVGRSELEMFIKSQFSELRPDSLFQWLTTIRWKAIFTTNYDDALETAYDLNPNQPLKAMPFGITPELFDIDPRCEVPIYHLHGRFSGSDKPLFAVTQSDYAKFREPRRMLFEVLKKEFATSTVLYIGYSDLDPNRNLVLEEMRQDFYPSTLPCSYRLALRTQPLNNELLRSQGIETIDASFEGFVAAASAALVCVVTCCACGEKIPASNRFCGMCGTPLPHHSLDTPKAQGRIALVRAPLESPQPMQRQSAAVDISGIQRLHGDEFNRPQEMAASGEAPAVQSEAPVLADSLAILHAEAFPAVEDPHYPRMEDVLKQIELEDAKASGRRDEPRFPDLHDELSLPALGSKTPRPNGVSPPITEEEVQRTLAQERALLASMMGLDSAPFRPLERPAESPFAVAVSRETSAAPAITSDRGTGVKERWGGKRLMLLATAAVLVLAALGALQWRSHKNRASNGPVEATQTKIPVLTRSNPEEKGYDQSGMSTGSQTHTSSAMTKAKEQSEPQDQSVVPTPLSKASPALQADELHDGVLRPPEAIPRNTAMVKEEDAPPSGTTETPGSTPGGLPNGVPNSVTNIVRDLPVVRPTGTAQKVRISSGVVQGLLVHQVTPQYPPLARQERIGGTVALRAVIGKDGTVQSLHVLSGHFILAQAAMDAVRQWRYKPYYLNGEPVEVESQINVNFVPY